MLTADGFDDAVIGVLERAGSSSVVLYDAARCVELLVEQGYTYEEALEHFYFNVSGAYVGPDTPGFAWIGEELLEERGIVRNRSGKWTALEG